MPLVLTGSVSTTTSAPTSSGGGSLGAGAAAPAFTKEATCFGFLFALRPAKEDIVAVDRNPVSDRKEPQWLSI
jgi:hypothetical protein